MLQLAAIYSSAVSAGTLPTLGKQIMSDTKFFRRIAAGENFTARTFDKVVQWFSDNWPDDPACEWPKDLPRPAQSEAAA